MATVQTTIPVKILTDLEKNRVPVVFDDAIAIARFYNPIGVEDYYLYAKSGDTISCICRQKESDNYVTREVPIAEITGNPALQQDVYFKPKRLAELKFHFSNVKFEDGGELPETGEIAPLNYTAYITAISEAMIADSPDPKGGHDMAHDVIDKNLDLIKQCYLDGLSYRYTANRLLGKVGGDLNTDIIHYYFFNEDAVEVSKRLEWFDKTDKSLTIIREKEAITRNHVYEELAELTFMHPVILNDDTAKVLLKDIHAKSMTEGDICLMVYNYEKPTRNFKMIMFGKKYLLTKYALQLKEIVFKSMSKLGVIKSESEIKCAIKQP